MKHREHLVEHRPLRAHAVLEKRAQILLIPAARGQIGGQQARCQITIENAAGHALVHLHRAGQAAWRMAFAAVTENVDHVLAALPRLTFAFGRLQLDVFAVEHVPAGQTQTHIERKAQAGHRRGAFDRLDGFQIRVNRIGVGARHQVIRGVRHRWIQIRTVAPLAFGQRSEELVIVVQTDAVLFARGDVGAVDRAEWREDRQAAGIRGATRCGVAGHAVSGAGEVFAALYLFIGVDRQKRRGQSDRKSQAGQ